MQIDGDVVPLIAVVLGIAGVGLPAALFSIAQKWSKEQPDLAGPILGGTVAVCILSILAGLVIILVCLGWLPPPTELFR